MSRRLVRFSDARAFMDATLPGSMPPQQHRTMQVRFYTWLCGYRAERYGIVVICPYCRRQRGVCRCPQLGHADEGAPTGWVYHTDASYVILWCIDRASLLRISVADLDQTLVTERRLGEFIGFVSRL